MENAPSQSTGGVLFQIGDIMNSNSTMIHKLQMAINSKGERITYNTSQFYSVDQDRPVTKYIIKKAIPDEDNPRRTHTVELFSAYSQIQIVLFLRDYWFKLNGMELPTDNKMWNMLRPD